MTENADGCADRDAGDAWVHRVYDRGDKHQRAAQKLPRSGDTMLDTQRIDYRDVEVADGCLPSYQLCRFYAGNVRIMAATTRLVKSTAASAGSHVQLQQIATAAAMNIDRLFDWFQKVPRAKTRTSRFAALAA